MIKSTSDDKIPGRWGLREPKFFADCEGEPVTIHLVNGVNLQGYIVGLDVYGVGVEVGETTVWVHKHAIMFIEREADEDLQVLIQLWPQLTSEQHANLVKLAA